LSGTATDWNALQAALDNNDAAKVKAAAGSDMRGTQRYYDACRWAIMHGKDKVLDALMSGTGGYNFAGKKIGFDRFVPFRDWGAERLANKEMALKLINEAYSSPNAENSLLVLYKHRKEGELTDFSPLETRDFLKEGAPVSLLKACLVSEPFSFGTCLDLVGMHSTEKLAFMMPYATEKDTRQISLRLLTLAGRGQEGDLEKVMLLLASPLSPHYSYYKESLADAISRKDHKMIDMLLARAPLETFGEALVKEVRKNKNADAEIVHAVEVAVERALLDKFNAAAEVKAPPSQPQTQAAPAAKKATAPAETKPQPPAAEKAAAPVEKKIYLRKQAPKKITLRKV
jgi:hypothetical protein